MGSPVVRVAEVDSMSLGMSMPEETGSYSPGGRVLGPGNDRRRLPEMRPDAPLR